MRITSEPSGEPVDPRISNGLYRAVLVKKTEWDGMSGSVPPGTWQPFTDEEAKQLRPLAGMLSQEELTNPDLRPIWILHKRADNVHDVAQVVADAIRSVVVNNNAILTKTHPIEQ